MEKPTTRRDAPRTIGGCGGETRVYIGGVRDRGSRSPTDVHTEGLAPVVERNIEALVEQRRAVERDRTLEDRVADAITRFTGSMRFVYIHLVLFGLWIVINLGWLGLEPFDPSFVVLAMVASVEAIFLSTFVLITQSRMAADADRRADLDLQISLLAEHEITRLIRLTSAIAERLEVRGGATPELEELARDVAPEKVMQRLEEEA
jgi:uncharacterized membrane protein